MQAAEPPPLVASRRGLRLRFTDGGKRSYFEVESPGELERIKGSEKWPLGGMPSRSRYMRAMGYIGMAGRLAVEVCVYEHRVATAEELRLRLHHFRDAARDRHLATWRKREPGSSGGTGAGL
jgi:hypothetical protein